MANIIIYNYPYCHRDNIPTPKGGYCHDKGMSQTSQGCHGERSLCVGGEVELNHVTGYVTEVCHGVCHGGAVCA